MGGGGVFNDISGMKSSLKANYHDVSIRDFFNSIAFKKPVRN